VIAGRSLVVRDGIRMASPLAAVVGTMLFFAGHNQPGGGFAAGLVFGSICALRSVVGLSVPRHPIRVMALGGTLIGLVAIGPLFVGDVALDQYVWETTLPILEKVKAGTALVFDLGVTLIVLGLILAVLDGLGADELPGSDGPDLPELHAGQEQAS
jgi:multicomponent Na+:H+ antiporter subunit A